MPESLKLKCESFISRNILNVSNLKNVAIYKIDKSRVAINRFITHVLKSLACTISSSSSSEYALYVIL